MDSHTRRLCKDCFIYYQMTSCLGVILHHALKSVSYMIAHVLFILLNELRKRDAEHFICFIHTISFCHLNKQNLLFFVQMRF